jgi:peptidoglycan/xylan/chitin deacetylase (PgdA/CDA1 family)
MNKVYNIVPIDKTKSPEKVVLLTFDDGPKQEVTLKPLLDTLDKHHAKAIFFVNGFRIQTHPELLKEIDTRGQVIGNHTYNHIMLGKEKEPKIRDEIERTQQIIKKVVGKTPVFLRPPFASSNDTVRKVCKDNGLLYMTWSNGSLDWTLGKKTPNKPQTVINNVLKQLHPGSNILMHELPWTGQALDGLLTQLEAKGYSFVDPNAIEVSLKS